jgi:hypothetical protein
VAQALDYATWVESLAAEKIIQTYRKFSGGRSLDEAFKNRFGVELDEDELNHSHQIIICASELDSATERIVGYLNDKDIPINVLFFRVFQHGEDKLLSRTWLLDPTETQENVANTAKAKGPTEPWIGEFYGSFGEDHNRSWAEAVKYGFFSAGGGSWYSQTLKMLQPDDRIWVRIPGEGYVGVGRVKAHAQPANEFLIETPDGAKPCLEVLEADYLREFVDDSEKCEYFVQIEWLDTIPSSQAIHETGFFGQQNSVCKPRTTKWRHTVDQLKKHFEKWEVLE